MAYSFAEAPRPRLVPPAGATDTHMHIYEPGYPMAASAVIPPQDGPLADYKQLQARLGLQRVVVVQPSTYGLDNRCTLEAVAKVGVNARAVIVANDQTTDQELEAFHKQGARGVRLFMMKGGPVGWEMLDGLAGRARDLGWHIQLQLDGRTLPDYMAQLDGIADLLVIDHVGRFVEPVSIDHPGFSALLSLVDRGASVKLSAPYESSKMGAPWSDIGMLAKELVKRAPDRMVWATNWPHPMQSPRPDDAPLLDMLLDWVPNEATRTRILVDNSARLYGF
jgi:D-galactarolactone isomerase